MGIVHCIPLMNFSVVTAKMCGHLSVVLVNYLFTV